MLEFEPNTLPFMTAALELEQCCKKLKNDTPEARKFIADKLKERARRGRASQIALAAAGMRPWPSSTTVALLIGKRGIGSPGWLVHPRSGLRPCQAWLVTYPTY
jgi:hypothetical protein